MSVRKARLLLHSNLRILVFCCLAILLLSVFVSRRPRAASFTSGNLVVVRVGDGSAAPTPIATAVFLDEYTKAGTLAQSIAMPTAVSGSNAAFTLTGNATTEGALNRSYDGKYLTLGGYNATPGSVNPSATPSSAVNRVVARVDSSGNVDTTTLITDAYNGTNSTSGNIRSAVTNDGTSFWTAGTGSTTTSGGVRYVTYGTTGTSVQITPTPAPTPNNTRVVSIFPGYNGFPTPQLYVSSSTGTFQGVSAVGSGLPTTASQTYTLLPAASNGSSPYAYIFFDLNASVSGVDTLYVADDRGTGSGGGVQRWDYNGTTWTNTYTLTTGLSTGVRGLTGTLTTSGNPVLWATTTETSANKIVRVTDTGSGSSFSTVATAAANTVFRGIAFAPTASGGPTAADGTISGYALAGDGSPLVGATVTLSGTPSRRIITDAEGHYVFNNVETNGFYTLSASRLNYRFSPQNISFSFLGNKTDAVFTGTPAATIGNSLDSADFFVRQQYVDFLGREPDEGGFNYWTNEITKCGADAACTNQRRRDVSAAFFIAEEFQQTGAFLYNLYEAGLGRRPSFADYSQDRARISAGPQLDVSKAQFAADFVNRAEFAAKYQSATSGPAFVDALTNNIRQSSGIDLSARRDALLSAYASGGRAGALRVAAETQAFRDAEYNSAFVLTEYFNYLKREPEEGGYQFWLNVLNNREPGNYRGMVCSFVTSAEYQARFSPMITHSNAECGQ